MKDYKIILVLIFIINGVQAQQTITQAIFLRSNLINSTEILLYKEDNTNYYDLVSNNSGFGIYNSNSGVLPFFIKSNDYIGIGTQNPTEKLSVKGKIRAQEIKVELANWPDFVFAKNYQLPSLQATENHIKLNGHLPGIPSSAEVAKDGVELGEMNKKLLQKIEELTLYLIEMKKDNGKQDQQIRSLSDSNKKLLSEVEKIKTKP